jgi:hypothetical protein
MPIPAIIALDGTGRTQRVLPTTLHDLGKSEEYLEEIIAAHPELLELEPLKTGIHGPFTIFRQRDLWNALEKSIVPDILLFSASGHVIIVEVKLSNNQELRDRRVVAQIIDYSGAFVDRSEDELLDVFSVGRTSAQSWEELIGSLFPGEVHIENIANRILSRLTTGEIDMVIACDKAPLGLVLQRLPPCRHTPSRMLQ